METTAKDLRTHAKRILEAVERGQEVTITHRGKARAKLVPVRPEKRTAKARARELPLFGMWKDRADLQDVAAYVRRLRSGRR